MSLASTVGAVLRAHQAAGWAFLKAGRVPDQVSLASTIGTGLGGLGGHLVGQFFGLDGHRANC